MGSPGTLLGHRLDLLQQTLLPEVAEPAPDFPEPVTQGPDQRHEYETLVLFGRALMRRLDQVA